MRTVVSWKLNQSCHTCSGSRERFRQGDRLCMLPKVWGEPRPIYRLCNGQVFESSIVVKCSVVTDIRVGASRRVV